MSPNSDPWYDPWGNEPEASIMDEHRKEADYADFLELKRKSKCRSCGQKYLDITKTDVPEGTVDMWCDNDVSLCKWCCDCCQP